MSNCFRLTCHTVSSLLGRIRSHLRMPSIISPGVSLGSSFNTSFEGGISLGGQNITMRFYSDISADPPTLCADVLSAALDSGVAIAIILIFFWYFPTFFVGNGASSFPEKSSISKKWDYRRGYYSVVVGKYRFSRHG